MIKSVRTKHIVILHQCASLDNIAGVKEYRSRSVVVLTPSLGSSPQHIAGVHPTYKMRNISEHSEQIFSKLSGFVAIAICGAYAKIRKS